MIKIKQQAKVTDPPRYPDVINGYENEMKKNYSKSLEKMTISIGVKMVEILKQK